MVYTVHGILQVRVRGKQNMANIHTYKEYTHTRDYYPAIKRNMGTWMHHKNFMLSERSQTQRLYIVWFHLCEVSRTGRSLWIQCRWLVAEVGGGGSETTDVSLSAPLFTFEVVFWNSFLTRLTVTCSVLASSHPISPKLWWLHFLWLMAFGKDFVPVRCWQIVGRTKATKSVSSCGVSEVWTQVSRDEKLLL